MESQLDLIDRKIIEEKNAEIRSLSEDLSNLSEIYQDLSLMIFDQGEEINIVEKKIEIIEEKISEGTESLNKAQNGYKNFLRDGSIIIGTVSLGALGFIGGPIIGIVTLFSGVVTGTGLVFISHQVID